MHLPMLEGAEKAEALRAIPAEKGGPSRCGATCPSCGETCIAGVHPDQTHYCAQGHSWGK